MRARELFLVAVAAGAAFLIQPFRPAVTHAADAKADGSAVLSGQVSSPDEPTMEGVLVSAKKEGSTISTTVVSDAQGRYRFPAGRLGSLHLEDSRRWLRPRQPDSVDVAAGKGATADIKLKKAANLAPQLTNADWLTSFPEPRAEGLLQDARIATRSNVLADLITMPPSSWACWTACPAILPNSFPLMVQPDGPGRIGGGEMGATNSRKRRRTDRSRPTTWRGESEHGGSVAISVEDCPAPQRQGHPGNHH